MRPHECAAALLPPLPLPRFHCGHLESPRRSVDSSRRRRLECPPPPPVGRHQQGIPPAPSQSLLSSLFRWCLVLPLLLACRVLIMCVLAAECVRGVCLLRRACVRARFVLPHTCSVIVCVLASYCWALGVGLCCTPSVPNYCLGFV